MIYKYAHPEWFDSVEVPDLEAFDGKIIIHGTEAIGALAAHALQKKGINYVCFTDNDVRKHGTEFFGHKVTSPAEAYKTYPDSLVFIASMIFDVINKQLMSIGFKEIHTCWCLFKEVDLEGFENYRTFEHIVRSVDSYLGCCLKFMERLPDNVMLSLQLNVTTRCNLRCKHCLQVIPYIKDKRDYDCDEFIGIVEKLTDLGFYVLSLNITSGEPFLYRDLHKLLRRTAPNKNIEKLCVITNATLIPDEELLDALASDPKIIVRMSDYGKLSEKLDELVSIFNKKNIKYEVTKSNFWRIRNKMVDFKLNPKELRNKFDNCTCAKHGVVVANSKVLICPGAATMELAADVKQDKNSVLDLKDKLTDIQIYNKVVEMLLWDEPITACQYCESRNYGEKLIKVPVAEQIED